MAPNCKNYKIICRTQDFTNHKEGVERETVIIINTNDLLNDSFSSSYEVDRRSNNPSKEDMIKQIGLHLS